MGTGDTALVSKTILIDNIYQCSLMLVHLKDKGVQREPTGRKGKNSITKWKMRTLFGLHFHRLYCEREQSTAITCEERGEKRETETDINYK